MISGLMVVWGGCLQASPGFRLYCSWQLRLELAKQTAAAVEYMHANNIIHRDLTSYNLLVTDKFEAKVRQWDTAFLRIEHSQPESLHPSMAVVLERQLF